MSLLLETEAKRNKEGLFEQSISVSATGSVTTPFTFTVPTDRGKIIGISLTVANSTLAVIDGITFSISGNGTQIYQDVSILQYSTLYNYAPAIAPVTVNEGGEITGEFINDQATAVVIYVNFYFAKAEKNC